MTTTTSTCTARRSSLLPACPTRQPCGSRTRLRATHQGRRSMSLRIALSWRITSTYPKSHIDAAINSRGDRKLLTPPGLARLPSLTRPGRSPATISRPSTLYETGPAFAVLAIPYAHKMLAHDRVRGVAVVRRDDELIVILFSPSASLRFAISQYQHSVSTL